jgi:hypothetical protein
MNKKTNVQPLLTKKVKNAFKNFNALTREQQSAIMGGLRGDFQDNGIGEDLLVSF